jgi:hypothetical protein
VSGGRAVNRLLAPLGITLQRSTGPGRATAEQSLGRLAELVLDLGYRPPDAPLARFDLLFAPEASGLCSHDEYAAAVQRRPGDDSLRSLDESRLGELG